MYCLGVNDRNFTFLVPVAVVPTCKKDYQPNKSTHTVRDVAMVIYNKYHELGLHEKLGPLATANSDGAAQFRKGMGQLLGTHIPRELQDTFNTLSFFNTVGGDNGMTIACDLDHLGKRVHARICTTAGLKIGAITFTKIYSAASQLMRVKLSAY